MLKIGIKEDISCGSYDFTNSFLLNEVHMAIFCLLMLILYDIVGTLLVSSIRVCSNHSFCINIFI